MICNKGAFIKVTTIKRNSYELKKVNGQIKRDINTKGIWRGLQVHNIQFKYLVIQLWAKVNMEAGYTSFG